MDAGRAFYERVLRPHKGISAMGGTLWSLPDSLLELANSSGEAANSLGELNTLPVNYPILSLN